MRVIPEKNFQMSDKDSAGLHHVKDCSCLEDGPCFSFDLNGRGARCDRFRKLPTGVKFCVTK